MSNLVLRKLVRAPAFTVGVLALLAWGIGSATALFSVVDAICFRPLDAARPAELVRVVQREPGARPQIEFPYLFFNALLERSTDFASIAGQLDEQVVITQPAPSEAIHAHLVTPQFFSMLGVPALYGRALVAADEKDSSDTPPAVLSYSFWDRKFSSDPRAIGQTVLLNAHAFVIVGVMPRSFNGFSADTTPEVRVPFRALALLASDKSHVVNPFVTIAARLKPGVDRSQAEAAALTIWRQTIVGYWNGIDPSAKWTRANLEEDLRLGIQLESNERGFSVLRDRYGEAWALLGLSALVLVVLLCANLATIILARNAANANELALRLALGATRGNLFRLLLSESAVLAAVGGAAGIVIAYLLIPVVTHALPPIRDLLTSHITTAVVVGRDWRPLAIGLGLSVASFAGFGLAPALHSSRAQVKEGLRSGHVSRRSRGQRRLLGLQIAICTILLAWASLLIRTFSNLRGMNPGFDAQHIVSFTVDPVLNAYTPEQANHFRDTLMSEVGQLPGVASVATARFPTMRGSGMMLSVAAQGVKAADQQPPNTTYNCVSDTYFQAMGMTMLAGRTLSRQQPGTPNKTVGAVVNQSFARRFFPNISPLGRHFGHPGDQDRYEVQGVVSDAKFRSLREPIQPVFYVDAFRSNNGRIVLYVRTQAKPQAVIEPVRKVFSALDPRLPVTDVQTLEEELDLSTAGERLNARLATAFALFAATLAALGLYGLMALVVTQRRRELAIYLAVGAPRSNIVALVSRQFISAVAGGAIVGVAATLFLGSYIRSLLYEVSPTDWKSILIPVGGVVAIAFAGAVVPLTRAALIEPAAALRQTE